MFPQTSTVIFKRELYDKNGGFDETMTHAEDGDLWIRFCNSSNFYFLPQSLVVTGGGKPSYGHSGLSANLSSMYRGNLKILKKSLENKIISRLEYNLLFFFYVLKYYRRIVITKLKY
ncbi:hypothetical protein SDC9_145050 [bioreactor metagenome]|uniref:Uncharacterized protein n=1 Tax=bioreactor metagenome TaxID=1076179 RepID=A0A645E7X5_9ZZZZ